jgi:hypothetical protein
LSKDRGGHSFVAFYMDRWAGGTSRMTRLVRSVYFDVCFHNWDKVEPMSIAAQALALDDLGEQGHSILAMLVAGEKLERDDNGAVWSVVAMEEGLKARTLFEQRQRGGSRAKTAGNSDGKTLGKTAAADMPKSPNTVGENRKEESREEEKGEDSPLPPAAPAEPDPPEPDLLGKRPTKAECASVMEAWNAMAVTCGLSQAVKLTDPREKSTRCRIEDYGREKIAEAMALIPSRNWLLGDNDRQWKADFEWFIRPDSIAKLLEGNYATGNGGGKPSGWRDL